MTKKGQPWNNDSLAYMAPIHWHPRFIHLHNTTFNVVRSELVNQEGNYVLKVNIKLVRTFRNVASATSNTLQLSQLRTHLDRAASSSLEEWLQCVPVSCDNNSRHRHGSSIVRRRKVRCNERRPRCAHCERLNLDCTWNRPTTSPNITGPISASMTNSGTPVTQHHVFNPNLLALDGFNMGSNTFFDFSGPLGIGTWDEAMLLSPSSWPCNPSDLSTHGPQHQIDAISQPAYQQSLGHQSPGRGTRKRACSILERGTQQAEPASTSPFSAEDAPSGTINEDFLLNTFLQMLMPPILATTEIGPKWATTRAFFNAMAAESLVVRSAIMAFTAMQMQRSGMEGDVMKTDWRPLYDSAARNLSSALANKRKEEGKDDVKMPLKYFLASLFLLTYTDVSSP